MNRFTGLIHFLTKPLVVLHLILLFSSGASLWLRHLTHICKSAGRHLCITPWASRVFFVYQTSQRWRVEAQNDPHHPRNPAVFGHLFFIFLGKVAAVFNIDPPTMYMAARMIAAVALFWSTILVYISPSSTDTSFIGTIFHPSA